MPNLKINNKTYSGVNEVHIPLASGSGNEDFAYITSETKSITENGTHDVKHYGTVNVNVPTEGEGIIPSGTKTITENGTYDVTEYASANVKLPTATQATPSISVSSSGLITASATQSAGVVSAGTKSATKQLSTQAAKTVTPSASNQTAVEAGKYTTGEVTVAGDSKLVAGNIKSGVSIFGVTGTYAGSGSSAPKLQEKSVTPSETAQIVTQDSGYDGLAIVNVGAISKTYVGSGVTKKSAQTYTPGTNDQTIAAGQYLNGTQTIKGDSDLVAGNIKKGISIFGVTGTLETESGGIDTSDATATANDMAKDVTAYVNGKKVTGELEIINHVEINDGVYAYYTPGNKTFGIWATTTNNTRQIITPKFQVIANFDGNEMGDATAEDVVKGKTFSSVNGMKLAGTYEPPAGGGGGGLPAGVTALATDTFTPASDISNSLYEIAHGLGVVPNFFVVMVDNVPTLSSYTKSVLQVQGVRRPVGANAATVSTMYVSAYEAVSALTQNLQSAEANDKWTADSLSFDLYSYALKAGYTYRWICGVAEGLG